MVGTSKILTVSYGTFSCTLEGFDDSFNTMKAIAEYFRGLAADDRYFGAEPPTPDAEMLARIAEREIERRVDAHMENNEIVLRAAALSAPETAESARPAADKNDNSSDNSDEKPPQERKAQAKNNKTAPAEPEDNKSTDKDVDVAARAKQAKMLEEAAAQAERKPADAQEAAAERDKTDKDEAQPPKAREGKSRAERRQARAERRAQEAEDTAKRNAKAEKEEPQEKAAQDEAERQRKIQKEAEEKAKADEKQKAEKAKADAQKAAKEAEKAAKEKEAAEKAAKEKEAAEKEALKEAERKRAERRAERRAAREAEAAAKAKAKEEAEAKAKEKADAKAKEEAEAKAKEEARAKEEADAKAKEEAKAQTDAKAGEEANEDSIAAKLRRLRAITDGESDDGFLADAAMIDGDPLAELEAHEAELAAGKTDQNTAAAPEPESAAKTEQQAPSDQGEQETKGNQNKAQAEPQTAPDLGQLDGADELDQYLEDSDYAQADAAFEDAAGPTGGNRGKRPKVIIEKVPSNKNETRKAARESVETAPDDVAVNRLMTETDNQLNEPESKSRREALAQLKAAVAATEASRKAGEEGRSSETAEQAYRTDLSQSVEAGTNRPAPERDSRNETRTSGRSAPLKLVEALRVDRPQASDNGSANTAATPAPETAQPRSVHRPANGSFAEFAEEMGAKELPDLLEAAAAYTAYVEGAEEFSRPQILRRARAATNNDFNREDGLRSFADLLEQGRFTKVRSGRFQVADDTRFKPERQAS